MATTLYSNSINDIILNKKTNNLNVNRFHYQNRHQSAKNLTNDIKEIKDFNNFISNSNISEMNQENNLFEKKNSNYSINIIPINTKLIEKNEIFFIKNNEPHKVKSSCLKIPKININAFNDVQISIDNRITKLIQEGENYESIYNSLSDLLKEKK